MTCFHSIEYDIIGGLGGVTILLKEKIREQFRFVNAATSFAMRYVIQFIFRSVETRSTRKIVAGSFFVIKTRLLLFRHMHACNRRAKYSKCRLMSLALNWKNTFGRALKNLFSPMVMAAEPGKSGIELENSSKLSVYTRSKSPKNIEIFAKSLSAEIRNGVMAPRNIAISVDTNETNERGVKMESNSASPMKAIDGYGEEKLFSLDNNSNNNGNSDVSSSPQEKLILLHSNLIERQEQIIRKKDKEILDLKQEKEQVWFCFCLIFGGCVAANLGLYFCNLMLPTLFCESAVGTIF